MRLIEEGFAPSVCLRVTVVKCSDGSVVSRFDLPKTSLLDFSPRGTILVTWQVYSSELTQSRGPSPDVEWPEFLPLGRVHLQICTFSTHNL